MIFLVLLRAGCLFQAPYSTGLTFRDLYYCTYHFVVQSLSHVLLAVTPWTAAHQAPLSMGFPRQEY